MTNVQQTSLDSFKEETNTGSLGRKRELVFKAFKEYGDHTNLEISKLLNFPINQITGRVNELVKMKLLENKGKRRCFVSGRTVIVWSVVCV